jgi:hypothetical protein
VAAQRGQFVGDGGLGIELVIQDLDPWMCAKDI